MNELRFKINHHPYYINDQYKNKNKVIASLFKLSKGEEIKINKFIKRLNDII